MASIRNVTTAIQSACARKGIEVSPTLAAFISRTIIYDNPKRFILDKSLRNEDLTELVNLAVERLSEKDSPSLETLKMQVAFDSAYGQRTDEARDAQQTKDRKLAELQRIIINLKANNTGDFETFTTLYRQIFLFVKVAIGSMGFQSNNLADREMAAALESVFPRVSLKSFVTLNAEDKRKQLFELTSIVLGIRLFNKEIGKGGKDLPNLEDICRAEAADILSNLKQKLAESNEQCQEYVDVLLHVIYGDGEATDQQVDRWQLELTNRRQLKSYVESLLLEMETSKQKIDMCATHFHKDMQDLKQHVGGRNSVSKEVVYPKFDVLAKNWLMLASEQKTVSACESVLKTLMAFRMSFKPTLPRDMVTAARKAKIAADPLTLANTEPDTEPTDAASAVSDATSDSQVSMAKADSAAVLVSPETTPDIANLPFEFNGYCPWTIVERNGLLLPGNPQSCGAVRHNNCFYTFVTPKALEQFRQRPNWYLEQIKKAARAQPELINLLGLQDQFPDLQLGNIGSRPPIHPLLDSPEPKTRDASTETPLHFVEKHIDYNYKWNTWDLRRKAIQYANLRKAKTTSMQTNSSHFRAAAASQVWLPKEHGTQTGISKGTNPIRDHNYLTGLRGGAVHSFEARNGLGRGGLLTKYAKLGRKSKSAHERLGRESVFRKSGASVLNMRLEL